MTFIDSNRFNSADCKPTDWLFVDRVHLTDLGNQKVVEILASGCSVA